MSMNGAPRRPASRTRSIGSLAGANSAFYPKLITVADAKLPPTPPLAGVDPFNQNMALQTRARYLRSILELRKMGRQLLLESALKQRHADDASFPSALAPLPITTSPTGSRAHLSLSAGVPLNFPPVSLPDSNAIPPLLSSGSTSFSTISASSSESSGPITPVSSRNLTTPSRERYYQHSPTKAVMAFADEPGVGFSSPQSSQRVFSRSAPLAFPLLTVFDQQTPALHSSPCLPAPHRRPRKGRHHIASNDPFLRGKPGTKFMLLGHHIVGGRA